MNKKTLIILAGIFCVLLLIAFFPALSGRFKPQGGKAVLNAEVDFSPFTSQSVESFSIKKGGEEKKFNKKDNVWQVDGYEASQTEVQDFFGQLGKIKAEFLVSKNSGNHKSYGLDEANGILLTLSQKGQTTSFLIGNSASSGFYAKKHNSGNAYIMSGGFISTELSQDVSAWRNKTVLNIAKDQFQKAELIAGGKTVTAAKNQDGKLEAEASGKKQVLEQAVSDKILMAINPLVADGFLNNDEITEFQKAANKNVIRLTSGAGQPIELQLIKKGGDWWGQVSGRDAYYKFSDSKFAELLSLGK